MHVIKRTKAGNATGATSPREVLVAADLDRADEVTLQVRDGKIGSAKIEESYNRAMEIGRAFNAGYRRTMAALAR